MSPTHEMKGSEPAVAVSVTGVPFAKNEPLDTGVPLVSAATVPPLVAA